MHSEFTVFVNRKVDHSLVVGCNGLSPLTSFECGEFAKLLSYYLRNMSVVLVALFITGYVVPGYTSTAVKYTTTERSELPLLRPHLTYMVSERAPIALLSTSADSASKFLFQSSSQDQ